MPFNSLRADFGQGYCSFEVFHHAGDNNPNPDERWVAGWYWWPIDLGRQQAGEPQGPFNSQQTATDDAHSK